MICCVTKLAEPLFVSLFSYVFVETVEKTSSCHLLICDVIRAVVIYSFRCLDIWLLLNCFYKLGEGIFVIEIWVTKMSYALIKKKTFISTYFLTTSVESHWFNYEIRYSNVYSFFFHMYIKRAERARLNEPLNKKPNGQSIIQIQASNL